MDDNIQQDKRGEMMSQEDKGLDVGMEDEDEFVMDCVLEELSIGRIVVDMDSMYVKSLKFSRKFRQLFGKDSLARADVLKDIACLIEVFRASSADDYFLELVSPQNEGDDNGVPEEGGGA